jgi:hypothetical protein
VCDGAGGCFPCLTNANCRMGAKCVNNVCVGGPG